MEARDVFIVGFLSGTVFGLVVCYLAVWVLSRESRNEQDRVLFQDFEEKKPAGPKEDSEHV